MTDAVAYLPVAAARKSIGYGRVDFGQILFDDERGKARPIADEVVAVMPGEAGEEIMA
jgi:hypothetical protein